MSTNKKEEEKDIENFVLKEEKNPEKTNHKAKKKKKRIHKKNNSSESINIKLKFLTDLTNDAFSSYKLDNVFIVFKSIDNIIYIIYANINNSIICLNLIDNKKICEVKNAHGTTITNFRYYFDKINERDLFLSISAQNNNIKVWGFSNMECILNIENIYDKGFLLSACFLTYNNQNFIITSNNGVLDNNFIKIYNFKGIYLKEISESNRKTFFIDSYYDSKLNKIYIITGNSCYSTSYDYFEDKIYYKYFLIDDVSKNNYSDDFSKNNYSIIINDIEKATLMIDSAGVYIRIWNFHCNLLLKKFKIDYIVCGHIGKLSGICLWDNRNIFVGYESGAILKLDLESKKIVKKLEQHKGPVVCIKTIIHPSYGKCLISKGSKREQIKLWINKNSKI